MAVRCKGILSLILLAWISTSAHAIQTWSIQNQGIPWGQGHEGLAADGACYGMVLSEKLFHEMGLDKGRSFSNLTNPTVSGPNGYDPDVKTLYVEQFAALAQNYALRNRDLSDLYDLPSDASSVDSSLVDSDISRDNPQILVLSNEAAVAANPNTEFIAHAVLIQERVETENTVVYKISDPNSPGSEKEIYYDKTTGRFNGLLPGYDTLRHDTTTLPDANQAWMEALVTGSAQPEGKEYLPVWRGDQDLPLTPEQYEKETISENGLHIVEPPTPTQQTSNGVSALNNGNEGGVRLYFDPAIVRDPSKVEARWGMVYQLVEGIAKGKKDFLVQQGGKRDLIAVNLSSLLSNGSDLAGLTRVTGFMINRKTGEIYLLGTSTEGAPSISLDTLSIALKTVWKNKSTPAVSLDPDPNDFFGPQHVRLECFPEDCRETEFTRVMLDADYEMKRLMLGEDKAKTASYQSFYDLVSNNPNALSGECFRWWLYPKDTAGAAVYHQVSGDMDVYLYDSEVQVLTETMKRSQTGLIGTGQEDPLASQAAMQFTSNYSQLEQQYPVLYQLHALLDVAKLAAVLRSENISSDILTQIADRKVKSTPVKESYEGIGPKIVTSPSDTGLEYIFIGGGVQTRSPIQAGDIVSQDDKSISDLKVPAESKTSLTLSMPSMVELSSINAHQANGNAEAQRAFELITAGKMDEAVKILDQAISIEPEHAKARTVRAIARMMQGDYSGSLEDINVACKSNPSLISLRGRIRLMSGDAEGGANDVKQCAAEFPDRPEVLFQKAWVEMCTFDLEQARKDFAKCRAMSPFDPEIEAMGKELRFLANADPDQAKSYLKAQLSIPPAVLMAFSRALTLIRLGDSTKAVDVVKNVLKDIKSNDSSDVLYIKERCWIVLANLNFGMQTSEGKAEGRRYLDLLAKSRPDWPSAQYYRIMLDITMPYGQAAKCYVKAAAMSHDKDPLLLESRVRDGRDLRTELGFQLAMAGGQYFGSDPSVKLATVNSVIDKCVAACSPGPAKQSLTLLKKALPYRQKELAGKLSEAEMKSLDQIFKKSLFEIPAIPARGQETDFQTLKMDVESFLEGKCRSAKTEEDYKSADKLFSILVNRLHSDWASEKTLQEAAAESMVAHSFYGNMLGKKIEQDDAFTTFKVAYDDKSLSLHRMLIVMDGVAEPMADNIPEVSHFSQCLMRASFYMGYETVLDDAEKSELSKEICEREQRFADVLEESAQGLVEKKMAYAFFTTLSGWAKSNLQDPELALKAAEDFHRRAARLERQFTEQCALR